MNLDKNFFRISRKPGIFTRTLVALGVGVAGTALTPLHAAEPLPEKSWKTYVNPSTNIDLEKINRDYTTELKRIKTQGYPTFTFGEIITPGTYPTGYDEMCARVTDYINQFCEENKDGRQQNMDFNKIAFHYLNQVNDYVNQNLKGVTDMQQHGINDFWGDRRKEKIKYFKRGDCEEFVMLKYTMLKNMFFDPENLSLTYVQFKNSHGEMEGHLVLLVRQKIQIPTGEQKEVTFVLDNLNRKILTVKEASEKYRFMSATTDKMTRWARVVPNF